VIFGKKQIFLTQQSDEISKNKEIRGVILKELFEKKRYDVHRDKIDISGHVMV